MGVTGEVDLTSDYDYELNQAAIETRRFVAQAKRVIEYINDGKTPADIPVTVELKIGDTTYRLPMELEYGLLLSAVKESIDKAKDDMMKRLDPDHDE